MFYKPKSSKIQIFKFVAGSACTEAMMQSGYRGNGYMVCGLAEAV